MIEIEISMGGFEVPFLGIRLSISVLVALAVTGIILVLSLIIRIFVIPRFKMTPKGFQNALEMIVDAVDRFAVSAMGEHGRIMSCYVFAAGIYIIIAGWIELFGIRSPLTDLNATAALGLITFLLINILGFAIKGFRGRMKKIANPNVIMAPIKLVTDAAVPISLACRMFGNMLGGFIVMELIYAALTGLFKSAWQFVLPAHMLAIIPGVLSMYFTLFHVAIQMYIYMTLSLSFIGEVIE